MLQSIGVGRGKKQMEGDFLRRSSRRQKVRGEREFIVNSDMMLRDFKVKVNVNIITYASQWGFIGNSQKQVHDRSGNSEKQKTYIVV